jgi:uncharacterized protein with PIN domain
MHLIKTNAKYMPGTRDPVEYDARCPACNKEIGRMSWGKLEITQEAASAESLYKEPVSADAAPLPKEKLCPHCGKPLPADF